MKRLAIFQAFSANGKSAQYEKTKEEVLNIAISLHIAFYSYKNEERSACVSELTEKLSFELVKDVTHKVPKNCEVDSLIVGNDELQRWGYFKSVDLGYIKDVEIMIAMKTSQSHEIAGALADVLQSDGLTLISHRDG